MEIAYTLVAEGSADRVLLPILDWLLEQATTLVFQHQYPDLRILPNPPRTLLERVRKAVELAPCELLFVHRDADRVQRGQRALEIRHQLEDIDGPPAVCVIPVRMTEAWLLFDLTAIRRAAGNPNGTQAIRLPEVAHLESLSNPKEVLRSALREASGLRGRRLRRWSEGQAVSRVANEIADYAPLRALPAFNALESELTAALDENGWLQ